MKKIAALMVFFVFIFAGCSGGNVPASNESKSLSNKTLGWGFRRTEKGPEFSKEQIHQMTENGCIYKENTDEKNIFLTFDEGYENGYTGIILDILYEKGVEAAFFVTGQYVRENPDMVKRMEREGHIIGNHTVNHPSLPSVEDEKLKKELLELDRLVYGITGQKTKYLRPPKGEYSERTLKLTSDMGYINVFWSDTYVDWNNDVSREKAHNTVVKNLHSGEVLLLHAVSKGNSEALSDIIDTARKNGYTFKSLDEYKFIPFGNSPQVVQNNKKN